MVAVHNISLTLQQISLHWPLIQRLISFYWSVRRFRWAGLASCGWNNRDIVSLRGQTRRCRINTMYWDHIRATIWIIQQIRTFTTTQTCRYTREVVFAICCTDVNVCRDFASSEEWLNQHELDGILDWQVDCHHHCKYDVSEHEFITK